MGQDSSVSFTIPSKLSEVPVVQQRIVSAVATAGFARETIFAIRLALDEALTNAVRHGNAGDESKSISVEYSIDPTHCTVSIEDEGPGFDPRAVADPTSEDNLDRPHGRGVMLMRAYMTEVSFNRRGNRVTLVKARQCAAPRGRG